MQEPRSLVKSISTDAAAHAFPDREYEIRQLRVFQEMVNKDLIYRAAKPVMWSPTSKTALAEAEVSYKDDHVSESVFAKFPLVEQGPAIAEAVGGLDGSDKISLIVWTTTPWTLPANMVSSRLAQSISHSDPI